MSEYGISQIYPTDRYSNDQVDKLLLAEGIRRDGNLDYTCGMYDDDMNIIATGSCFGNTLRCMAVSSAHQGEGLMNAIVSHLISYQYSRGNMHLFLYTKCDSAKFFGDLGFHEIVRIEGRIVFMENRRTGFADYLDGLKRETAKVLAAKAAPAPAAPRTAALVMNANPFTNGHLYLVEKACAENDFVHLFMVSEDASLVPFAVRKRLIMEGTSNLPNLIYHESGPYVISSATFPSYFQKDADAVVESHARIDLETFVRIAKALGIDRRIVAEEPFSETTNIYNRVMREALPPAGIDCMILPRFGIDGVPVSASAVRQAIHDGDWDTLEKLVPPTTSAFFRSPEAAPIIERIRGTANVVHH